MMGKLFNINKDYSAWLKEIKNKVRIVQIKAAVKVNSEMLSFYWELGADIIEKQVTAKWGEGFIFKLSHDLTADFPYMKGFLERNIKYIRQWYLFYNPKKAISQQAVGQLTQIPWGHNIAIISKCKNIDEALYYAQSTMMHNWSRSVLVHQIESGLYAREGKSITNFKSTLPKPQSDLASQTLKDPYIFDFLTMTKDYNELDLEKELVPDLNRDIALSTEIRIAPYERLKDFNHQCAFYFEKLNTNNKQICTLEKLRDTLLSKLMRGEVRVEVNND